MTIHEDVMTSHEIAEWVKAEHAKVEELSDKLRECVAVVPRSNIGAWIHLVRDRFESFRAHMVKHMTLEEHNGYLRSVVELRPTLSPQVDRLKHEHEELVKIMAGIHLALVELSPNDRLLVRDCCRRIDLVLSYTEHHENDENMLVTFVFTHDMGSHD